jgi:hypothetical protein
LDQHFQYQFAILEEAKLSAIVDLQQFSSAVVAIQHYRLPPPG